MTGDWRDWRPAIWLAMLGVAVMLVANPWYWGAPFVGAGLGVGIGIYQRRRRATLAAAERPGKKAGKRR